MSLGKYLEFIIQSKDFSPEVLDIAIVTGQRSHFGIKAPLIKNLLQQIHKHPDQKNIFGYLVEISAFRGIFSIMRELIDSNDVFQKFVVSRLHSDYFAFEQIIRFLRNIFSHSTTSDLSLKTEDFIKQKDFLNHEKDPFVKLIFVYSKHWKEWK
ncbi:TPA: hypothetical protein DEP21_04595 [Patescibacteria group bacterium]|nr:hypothetical protein [Candidatus Gracilibacteria bacterium]